MKLLDLEPSFLKWTGDSNIYEWNVPMAEANGLWFLCPKCFKQNRGRVGTHGIVCWRPSVPQTMSPAPGRWDWQGTSLENLTLVAGSSSIRLMGGCQWHGFVRNGEIKHA